MEYHFKELEAQQQKKWKQANAYRTANNSDKPKYYVLDMFPYPSGAGLHVGHPLGYIASDIYARFKRLEGYNVLHPMGYDAFGLPAEQYAIEHNSHPKITTEKNIDNFRKQLEGIGFCYDWEREVRTCDPEYYKWTQWLFLQLFNSYFDTHKKKAQPIDALIKIFEIEGNQHQPVPSGKQIVFSAEDWKQYAKQEQHDILMQYRLVYCGYGDVNWCEALGTVLANDEIIDGKSERGGHPVTKKKLRQWYLRITAYADRLIEGLQQIDFSNAMKEMQSNWIGKSSGADILFPLVNDTKEKLRVYTTRPDTIYGVDFIVIAPEHEWVAMLTTPQNKDTIEKYIADTKQRSERERKMGKEVTGCFTGAYVTNPVSGNTVPVWISDYVLADYGTGAIMGVPCGDERDFKFAKHFNIAITNIIGDYFDGTQANPTKEATLTNSDWLNDTKMSDAIEKVIVYIEEKKIGARKVNYKIRDAVFSRQRYWGEPIPIRWQNGQAVPLSETELPLLLPEVDTYKPAKNGASPLANIKAWTNEGYETNTMPGYAGSSWYFLRYMNPDNQKEFCDKKISDYWQQVDVYVGGTEHAVGHLLYSRMCTKVLYDLGHINFQEPFKKLLNQGMVLGSSRFVYRYDTIATTEQPIHGAMPQKQNSDKVHSFFVSGATSAISNETAVKEFENKRCDGYYHTVCSLFPIHVDVNIVDGVKLDIEAFKKSKPEYANANFILENDGSYLCGTETEKMSKSKYNTVAPETIIAQYGADTFRMYEMFLGPIEQSKPWDTKGIEGVHRFLKKLWRLFYDEQKGKVWNDDQPTAAELKILHRTIKKIKDDTERFSYNTAVSTFMVCVNELTDLQCHKKNILEPLLILLSPYAPHIAEALWQAVGNKGFILDADFPIFDEHYVIETTKEYPISINGKMRTNITINLTATQEEVEKMVLANEVVQKWLNGNAPKKIIFVRGKMVNIVL